MANTIIFEKLKRPLFINFYKNNSFESSLRIEPRLIKPCFRLRGEQHVNVRIPTFKAYFQV